MANEASGGGEKTEKPTAKRLSEAAKNGDILQSRDLAMAMVVMAGIATMAIMGPQIMAAIREMLREGLRIEPGDIATFAPEKRAAQLLSMILVPVGTILAATFAAAVAAPALLGSLGFRPGAFALKPSKLNPLSGLKRMFGMQGIIELLKSLAKVLLLGAVGGYLVWERIVAIREMGKMGIVPALDEVGQIFILVALTLAGVLFLIAGVDVPAQIMQRARRLNMSKQEIRDEHKETEGSPESKAAVRRRQMETMNGSIRKAVSEASVILTNPTHFAVALRYMPGRDMAPVVLARGADEIARAIRECGNEASVPVLQYPELTRAIYYTSRVNQVIDERLFLSVATVLAFVFRVENRMASEMDRPHIDLPEALRFDADGRNMVN
jgi:flagellar biosynthetic protein FlhB